MNRFNIVFLIILVPIVAFFLWFSNGASFFPFSLTDSGSGTVFIEGLPISVDVVDTREGRRQGLSDRDVLRENEGLLLTFPEVGAHGIWMRDMKFPIDIIWIAPLADTSSSGGGQTFRVVDIKQNARPDSFPEVFYPRSNALHVLEVNANFVEVHSIKVGDRVEL